MRIDRLGFCSETCSALVACVCSPTFAFVSPGDGRAGRNRYQRRQRGGHRAGLGACRVDVRDQLSPVPQQRIHLRSAERSDAKSHLATGERARQQVDSVIYLLYALFIVHFNKL